MKESLENSGNSILGTLFGFNWLSRNQEQMGAFLTLIAAFGVMSAASDDALGFYLFWAIFWVSWSCWITEQIRNIKRIRQETLEELAR